MEGELMKEDYNWMFIWGVITGFLVIEIALKVKTGNAVILDSLLQLLRLRQ